MLKTYGIDGQTTAIIKVPFNGGAASLEVEFKRGRIGAGLQNRPATYSTSDPVYQSIIENSIFFGHKVRLVRVIGDAEPEAPSAPKAQTPAAVEYHPEITSPEDAVAFLKARGAKATNLKDEESIKKYMAKIGVSFPNLYE